MPIWVKMKHGFIFAFILVYVLGFSQENSPYFLGKDEDVSYVLNSTPTSPDFPIVILKFNTSREGFLSYININSGNFFSGILYKDKSGRISFYVEDFKSRRLIHVRENYTKKHLASSYTLLLNTNYLIYLGAARCCEFHSIHFYERKAKKIAHIGSYTSHFNWSGKDYLFDLRYQTLKTIMFSVGSKFNGYKKDITMSAQEEFITTIDSVREKIRMDGTQISQDSLTKIFNDHKMFDSTKLSTIYMTKWNDNHVFKISTVDAAIILMKGKYFHLLIDTDKFATTNKFCHFLGENNSENKLEVFASWNGYENICSTQNTDYCFELCYFNDFVAQLLAGKLWFPWSIFKYGTRAVYEDVKLY